MSPETLRRRVVEMVRDVGDRKARVLEKPGRPDEPCRGEVPFWRRQAGTIESAHERTRQDFGLPAESANGREARRRGEQRLEKAPACGIDPGQIERQLRECFA